MKSLYTSFISGVVFPLQERLKDHSTVRVRKELEHTQWWSRSQLEAHQLQLLKKLLQHTARHVPYYRALFDRIGFDVTGVCSLNDLQKLPFLTKELIRANQDELTADNAADVSTFNTGGSSGEPLIFLIGKERVSHDVAAKWRATRWWDVDIGDREIVLWGSPIELDSQDHMRWLRDQLLRSRLLSAFEMSDVRISEFIDTIRNFRPHMLFGYPSVLAYLAQHAEKADIKLDNLGIKVVFVTSERLYQQQREIIERVFGCKVANGYGGRDAGFIAHECPHGRMHITAEDIIVEIVDQQGNVVPPGEDGEVVVTHLATRDFPFIRYRTGDVASLDATICSCGRGLPLLREIHGRTTDFIVAADGTVMHGLALIYVLRELEEVKAFKIVQESLQHTRIEVVVSENFCEEHVKHIKLGFRKRLGNNVSVSVETVDRIKPEKSGKLRYVISKVSAV